MYKPTLKDADGISRISLDICDIIELILKKDGYKIKNGLDDELFDRIFEYLDDIAGHPDYSNYN